MFSVTVTNHDAPKRFGHTIIHRPTLCIACGTLHQPVYKPAPGRPGVRLFDGPTVCPCSTKLGCWKILRSFSRGSARCFEDDPVHPERYRTRKEAATAKRAKGL